MKAKIKAANRKNLKRKIGQKRKMNGNRVQTNNRNDSMLTAQSSTDNVHFWLHSFFKQVQFLLKQIAANAILYDENHMDCFKEAMKICVWKEIAHDYRGLCILGKSLFFPSLANIKNLKMKIEMCHNFRQFIRGG